MQSRHGGTIINLMLNFLKNIGPAELILIAIVVFLLFGSKVLVNLSHKLGASAKEIKKVKQELKNIKEEVA